MPNTTNFNFPTPADTDLVKDGASAIRSLGNSIDTTFVDLKGGTTGQVLSKASNTDMDFTWVAQDDSNAIQNALLTTTGDTIYASAASTPARLGIGSTGQVLTVSGGLPVWATPSSGGMTLIQETVASSNSSISFSSISGSYKQLLLVWSGIIHSAGTTKFDIRFNNDSGTNYSNSFFRLENGTSNNSANDSNNSLTANYDTMSAFGNNITGTTCQTASQGTILIDNYASTTKFKTIDANWAFAAGGTATFYNMGQYRGVYKSTSAITSIDIFRISGTASMNNITNTSIRLYGVS